MRASFCRVLALAAALSVPAMAGAAADGAIATAVRVTATTTSETEFTLDLTAGMPVEIYTLAHPCRVVIDLPDVAFRLDPATATTGAGLVTAFRFGAMSDRRGRIVIDTSGPVTVTRAGLANLAESPGNPAGVRLSVGLTATDVQSFGAGTGVNRPGSAGSAVKPAVFDDIAPQGSVPAKRIIVIDPGHGGIDPGAIGPQKTTEKAVVLAVARALKATLDARGGYDVRLTRADDTFIALDRRVEFSRAAKADLFLSLHADAIEDGSLAKSIRGASIYTLSDKASDEQARAMADKENAADLTAGIDQSTLEGGDETRGILYDLMNRETAAYSHLLSRSLVDALGKSGALTREPERAAAFRVLKQAHAPSVLIELGFLSNPAEEQQMGLAHWQKQTAEVLAVAIDSYFAMRPQIAAIGSQRPLAGRLPP